MDSRFETFKVMARPTWGSVRDIAETLLHVHGNSENRNFAALCEFINAGREPIDELQFAFCLSGLDVPEHDVKKRVIEWCKDRIRELQSCDSETDSTSPMELAG